VPRRGGRTRAREPGRTAIRATPVRVTAGLDPATRTGLNRWAGTAAIAASAGFPRLPLAKAIRAMIHATAASEAVTSAVTGQPRQGQDLAGDDAYRRRARPSRFREQMTWQLRAARMLTGLLERGDREGLPVLEWTSSHNGTQVTGRSYAQPGSARRAALAAWAAALGITLGEEYHQDSRMTTITGTAKRERTRHGSAAITLTGDIWED